MKVDIAIIGSGIAGGVTESLLRHRRPVLFEARSSSECLPDHNAVMRLRDPSVGHALGADIEKIKVHKSLFFRGQHFSESNPRFNNLYSLKVTNGEHVAGRSINNLGTQERYLAKSVMASVGDNLMTDHRLIKVNTDKTLVFKTIDCISTIEYNWAVSTIPIPAFCKVAGIDLPFETKSYPIYITRWSFPKASNDLHQTIYFPDPDINVYRATISSGVVTVEGVSEFDDISLNAVSEAFGVEFRENEIEIEEFVQKYGKIVDAPGSKRKKLLRYLTETFGIFFVGRHATWRSIRSDELLQDAKVVSQLITSEEVRYESAKTL